MYGSPAPELPPSNARLALGCRTVHVGCTLSFTVATSVAPGAENLSCVVGPSGSWLQDKG